MAMPSSAAAAAARPLRSSAAPGPAPPEPPRATKVVLPRKKPLKWSTGTAPGEYGGPPATSKLRKYWGGEGPDPLSHPDGFIWNKDFAPRLRRLLSGDDAAHPAAPVPFAKESDSGFLSLNRAMSLDSMEIDLSRELAPPPEPVLERQVEAARRGRSVAVENLSSTPSPKWRLAPTRREQDRWDRAAKAATGGSDVILRESRKVRGDPAVLAAQSREKYFKLKNKMQLLTLGIGGVGVVSAFVCYSTETAFSFGAGLLGSLAYIRMLGNSVDSLADGAKGLIKGAAAQPRLLVPVALVMVYNRWNGLVAPEYGFMQLELIPMLVGFFTYKIATFSQAIEDTFITVEDKTKS